MFLTSGKVERLSDSSRASHIDKNLDETLRQAMPTAYPVLSRDQLIEMRDRILENLRQGKGRGRGSGAIASTSPQYKTAVKALDQFLAFVCSALEVAPIEDSTPLSTPENYTPDSRTHD